MSKINRDVLYLILKELEDDNKSLHLCLLVNKAWCKVIIPILWKNPWKFLRRRFIRRKEADRYLLKVIISHLSDKLKKKLNIDNSYKKPLFDYISFCKHLNLSKIHKMISTFHDKSKISIIGKEIINLFINGNCKFTHLYIPYQFDFQLQLIPGKNCLSEIKFLSCSTNINNNIFTLIESCRSIREMKLVTEIHDNNYGIIKLIETQNKITNISLVHSHRDVGNLFFETLKNSLIKHAKVVQYFMITGQLNTRILLSFVNLKVLELHSVREWNYLEDLYLPSLQVLKVNNVSFNMLTSLIKSTNGSLTEICIYYYCVTHYYENDDEKKIVQVIYQNCPYLKYLKIPFCNSNILELENLLINCQYLNGLYIIICENGFNWDKLFEILIRSSPTGLFKFKFDFINNGFEPIKLKSLNLFFYNWKNRHPMLLQFCSYNNKLKKKYFKLAEGYKMDGKIEKFDYCNGRGRVLENFEWI
jgi:hypothetical protein